MANHVTLSKMTAPQTQPQGRLISLVACGSYPRKHDNDVEIIIRNKGLVIGNKGLVKCYGLVICYCGLVIRYYGLLIRYYGLLIYTFSGTYNGLS